MIRELRLICKIWKWHKKTFPGLTVNEQATKLRTEVKEYIAARKSYDKSPYPRKPNYSPALQEETADVIIAGINCLRYPEIYESVAVKHAKNTHRTWEGMQHVDDD